MLSNRGIFLALLGATFCGCAFAVFSTANCGTGKYCLRLSSGCDAASADCVFFSWIWDGTSFQMELSGGTGGGSTYSAVAFGQVSAMQDADLYYCTGVNLESGVIGDLYAQPTPLNITNEAGITGITATTADGVAQCTFTRAGNITRTISNGASKDFDLSSGTYYILLATGSVTTGTIQYHHANKIISTSQYDMTASPSMSTAAPPSSTAAPSSTATQAAGCGVTKGCFQEPSGCTEGTSTCTYFTWAYDLTNNNWNMEISGGAGGTTYAGVAFGQVNGMQDADLYYCTGSALVSGAIVGNQQPPQEPATTAGLTNINTSTTNGVAKCTFTRAASVVKTDSSGTHDYDLSAASYYVLLARGALRGGVVGYHGTNRAISANKLDLTTNTGASAAGVAVLAKTHGALMITAWLVLSNLGMMIARHFRPLWPNTQPGGVKFWFTLHRAIMVTVLLCTAIAFIIIFVHVQGYSSQATAHAIVGIIVMALTLFNPTIAIFRPHPDAPKRWIFNWTHRLVGVSLIGLATANLFTGVAAMGLTSRSNAVLGSMVGWMVLGGIVMEILTWKYNHYSWSRNKKKDAPVSDGELQVYEEPKDAAVRGQTVKTVLLIVYGLGLFAFAITFYVEISNA